MTFKRLLSVMLVVCIVTSMLTISTSAESEIPVVPKEESEGDSTGGSTTSGCTPETASILSLTLDKDQIREGDTFSVMINTAEMRVAAVSVILGFDTDLLECVSITGARTGRYEKNIYLFDIEEESWIPATAADDVANANSDGKFSAAWANSVDCIYAEGLIATVTFKALKDGVAAFTLTEKTASEHGNTFDGAATSQTVTIQPHSWNTDWSYDADHHWYNCSDCDEKKLFDKHAWDEGTEVSAGFKLYTCICGAAKTEGSNSERTNLSFVLDKTVVHEDNTFNVTINIGEADITGLAVILGFDPDMLECTSITGARSGRNEGNIYLYDVYEDSWMKATAADSVASTNADGKFSAAWAYTYQSVYREGLVATLTFKALKPGAASITLTEQSSSDTGFAYSGVVDIQIVDINNTHIPGATVVENRLEPTCIQNGSYDNVTYCTICPEEVSRTTVEIPSRGHQFPDEAVVENRVEPTCTQNGAYDSVEYCTVCSEEISRTTVEIPSRGHQFPDKAVVENRVEPTCTQNGTYDSVEYCTVCSEELSRTTVEIPSPGHQKKVLPGRAATCTQTGLTAGEMCTVCSKILVAQQSIDKLPHEEVATAYVAPTFTTDGRTAGVKCNVCGQQLSGGKVIPKIKVDAVSDNVTVTYQDSRSVLVIVAFYDETGRCIGAQVNETILQDQTATFTIMGGSQSYRVFLTDVNWQPLCPAFNGQF